MSVARLYYKQTTEERYDERTNRMLRDMLEGMLMKISWEEGGTGFSDDPAALVAENEFEVSGKRDHIKFAHKMLQQHLGRPVTLTWIYPWYQLQQDLKWHLFTKHWVKRLQRKNPPVAPLGFDNYPVNLEDLPDDDTPQHGPWSHHD